MYIHTSVSSFSLKGAQAPKLIMSASFFFFALFSVLVHAQTESSDEQLKRLLQAGNFQSVINQLDDIPNKTRTQFNLLISAQMNVDLDDAEASADDFIQAYSNDYRAYHMHANVMGAQASSSIFSAIGYAKKAKKSLETAVTIAPKEPAVYQALMQFHVMAPSIAGGDMEEAKKLVEKIAQLDETEGAFARASYLAADDNQAQATNILAELANQPENRIRALYELGNLHINNEQYKEAFEALSSLPSAQVPAAEESDEKAWNAYSTNKFSQLHGSYRIGWLAVKTNQYTESGINALTHYLSEIDATDIDTQQLPSKNWANLRLAELFINEGNIPMAQQVIARIEDDSDKRLLKILKQLKKQLKKRT